MIFGDIVKGIFGDKGLSGGVVDVLKATGIIKDPEAEAKAIEALRQYEVLKSNIELEIAKVDAGDRDSARKREMEVKDSTPKTIAIVSFAGFFIILFVLMFVTVPIAAQNALLIMLGTLGGIVTSITAYYFGSSSGSAAKNALIEKMVGKNGK